MKTPIAPTVVAFCLIALTSLILSGCSPEPSPTPEQITKFNVFGRDYQVNHCIIYIDNARYLFYVGENAGVKSWGILPESRVYDLPETYGPPTDMFFQLTPK